MTSLKKQTISGVSWSAFGSVVGQIIQFLVLIALARLLSPEAFGLIGMIVIFTGFVNIFSDFGFGNALIQFHSITEKHRSSVFWLNILIGVILTILFAFSASIIANFYKKQILYPLTMFISFQFFIGSFNTVHYAILSRKMDFKSISIIEIITQSISGIVAVLLANAGYGVWSLAWKSLIYISTKNISLWWFSSWKPKFIFDKTSLKDLIGFSSNLMGFQFMNYWTRQADDFIIGKFMGPVALGIYSNAYRLMVLPLRQVTSVFTKVMFPALSKIKNDETRVKAIYLKSHRFIGFATIPMMIGLLIVADDFVIGIFGNHWSEMIPIVQILCLVGIKQPLGSTTGWIFQSQGRTDIMFKWNMIVSVITVLSFIIGLHWGTIGITWAYTITSYVIWYPSISIPGKLINLTFKEFFQNIKKIFLVSLLMGVSVFIIKNNLPPDWEPLIILAIEVTSGITIYIILSYLFELNAFRETLELLFERYPNLKLKFKNFL